MNWETELVRFDPAPGDPLRPSATPIYQTATFRLEEPDCEGDRFDYTRSDNPTRRVLETQLARLERGHRALAFASGMAALTAVTSLVEAGQTILVGNDLYGGTFRWLASLRETRAVEVELVDVSDLGAVQAALTKRPRLLLFESPSNPLQRIADIRGVCAKAREAGVLVAVDNSMMSPHLQRPLELGADLVVHSATKHLSGHGDVTAGVVVAREPLLAERIDFYRNAAGNGLAPFECWLLLRGLKTLALRLDRQQQTAGRLARFLRGQSVPVLYPGLEDHPGRERHRRQARGAGSVFALSTGSRQASEALIRALALFDVTVSFGSLHSTVSLPKAMSHASLPSGFAAGPLPDDLLRFSIGIEAAEDLEADLARALVAIGREGLPVLQKAGGKK